MAKRSADSRRPDQSNESANTARKLRSAVRKESDPDKKNSTLSRIGRFVRKLVLAIIFVLGAIASAVGLWEYLVEREYSEIRYNFSKLQVLDNSQTDSDISIRDRAGNEIIGNLYAVDITIWNSGSKAIDQNDGKITDDIIEPIQIILDAGAVLRGFKVVKIIDNKANQFATVLKNNRIDLSWRRFLPGTGFRAQALVEARSEFDIFLSGRILDVRIVSANETKNSLGLLSRIARHVAFTPLYVLFGIFALVMISMFFYSIWRLIIVIRKKIVGDEVTASDIEEMEPLFGICVLGVIALLAFGVSKLSSLGSDGVYDIIFVPTELRD